MQKNKINVTEKHNTQTITKQYLHATVNHGFRRERLVETVFLTILLNYQILTRNQVKSQIRIHIFSDYKRDTYLRHLFTYNICLMVPNSDFYHGSLVLKNNLLFVQMFCIDPNFIMLQRLLHLKIAFNAIFIRTLRILHPYNYF